VWQRSGGRPTLLLHNLRSRRTCRCHATWPFYNEKDLAPIAFIKNQSAGAGRAQLARRRYARRPESSGLGTTRPPGSRIPQPQGTSLYHDAVSRRMPGSPSTHSLARLGSRPLQDLAGGPSSISIRHAAGGVPGVASAQIKGYGIITAKDPSPRVFANVPSTCKCSDPSSTSLRHRLRTRPARTPRPGHIRQAQSVLRGVHGRIRRSASPGRHGVASLSKDATFAAGRGRRALFQS